MAGAVTVRVARLDDAAEIARLAGQLGYATNTEEMHRRLGVLISHSDHRISVAEDAAALLGWVAVERRRTLESGERIEIVGLVVDERARGTGVGRMLVVDAEQWARECGFDTLCVRSNIAREDSHPFYQHLGYVRRKTQHYYIKRL
ncbi:N-acetyltransferase [Dyella monticola]|uniref:N-acetyltransferase n=1 Tax=Dyella monticola TaxID=1927958 RepID=A0A370WTV6_9GAMM|nr:GNAT family N-acetyltransferase [Dyella monticola]RDS79550.1 N-acetyltransferase [Dyella monticola]